jgi:DNA-binding response OmpR family regulator
VVTLRKRILIVDPDPVFRKPLADCLGEAHYNVAVVGTAAEGLNCVYQGWPDFIIAETALPDFSGLRLCQNIREISNVPVVLLMNTPQKEEIVAGMQLGADLSLMKPISVRVLVARVNALIRRAYAAGSPVCEIEREVRYQDLVIELDTKLVTFKEKPIKLSPTEFRLLSFLVKHQGRALERDYLLREVWGPEYIGQVEHLRLYIGYLRRKFEADPTNPVLIQTIWGVGYRFGS